MSRIANHNLTRRPVWIIAGAVAIVVAFAAIWFLRQRQAAGDGQTAAPAMDGMAGMAMNDTTSRDRSVLLSADQIREFGITFALVQRETLIEPIRTAGIVAYDETRVASVTPKVGGYVERLYVDFTGQSVRRGEPMLDIYSPELVAAQEELLLAAHLDSSLAGSATVPGVPAGTSDLAAAARRRLRLWDISEAQIDDVLASGHARRTLTLYAPVSGIVVSKSVLVGQGVKAGDSLYTLADLSRVWIEAELREADAALVSEGDIAIIQLPAFPGRQLTGRIEYVYPTMNGEARTLTARIAVANPAGRIKPGMYATVRLSAPLGAALTVPAAAVLNTGERRIAFVDMGEGRFAPREVTIGHVAGDRAEVLSGLEEGQRVVTSAQFLLDSESNLAEVMKAMIGQMNTSDMGSAGLAPVEGADTGMKGMEMPGRKR